MMKKNNSLEIFVGSIIAGIFISIGGTAFLKISGIVGAILFSFGLIGVIHYKTPLFTGTAGFIQTKKDALNLVIILLGNILGCFVIADAVGFAYPKVQSHSLEIIKSHLELDFISQITMSMLCGFIMTTAVKFAREGKYLPLLFGVPVFILSGFIHSIADAFYLFVCPVDLILSWKVAIYYMTIVVGNFIGCNLYRIILHKKDI